MKKVILKRADLDALKAHSRSAYPNEACGLLYGYHGPNAIFVHRMQAMENAAQASAQTRFFIAAEDLLKAHKIARAAGEIIIGHYHSHPNGAAQPSAADVDAIADINALWLICAAAPHSPVQVNAFIPNSIGTGFKALDVEAVAQ